MTNVPLCPKEPLTAFATDMTCARTQRRLSSFLRPPPPLMGQNCKVRTNSPMPKQAHYNAGEHISATTATDPYLRPAFSFGNRLRRLIWNTCWFFLYRWSPRPFHAWRALLLRSFGATLGPNCHFYPASKVWAPWNLI